MKSNDDILKALENSFIVGREFTYDEIISITKEGKHRYEFKIPPGYGDLKQKEKKRNTDFWRPNNMETNFRILKR